MLADIDPERILEALTKAEGSIWKAAKRGLGSRPQTCAASACARNT